MRTRYNLSTISVLIMGTLGTWALAQEPVNTQYLTEVPINPIQGQTVEVVSDNGTVYVRSSGYVLTLKGTLQKGKKLQILSQLKGLESMIESVRIIDGRLWITKAGGDPRPGGTLESQLAFSDDGGKTFQPNKLLKFKRDEKTPFGNFTDYALITRIEKAQIAGQDALVINDVGPGAWASYDKGQTWKSLVLGHQWSSIGYPGFFEIVDQKVFFGGEHPLDTAYLSYGELSSKGAIQKLRVPGLPTLENRRIQFIKKSPKDSNYMYAGTEGGLLTSTDSGKNWEFTFKDDESSTRGERAYPYILNVVFPSTNPKLVLAGGQPQVGLGTVLVSCDKGKTWKDISKEALGNSEFMGLSQLDDGSVILARRWSEGDGGMTYKNSVELHLLTVGCD